MVRTLQRARAGRWLGHLGQDAAPELSRDGGCASAAGPILQRAQPFLDKAGPGLANGVVMQADLGTDLEVGLGCGRQQQALRPQRLVALAQACLGQPLQRLAFLRGQLDHGRVGA